MTIYPTDLRATDKGASPVICNAKKVPTWYRTKGKRALDIVIVFGTAWFTVPVIVLLAIAIMATGQAPFYTQDRVGMNNKVFRIWKLRTMLPNAKERLERYLQSNPEQRAEWESKQKLADDPRITPFGRFLRKASLDELPQLINVFNGTMSLIGPRPMMPEQTDQYTGTAYYRLRPGMSGFWQVSDRSDSDFITRVRHDEKYDIEVSLATDLQILAKTVGVVIRGTGV